MNAPQQRGGQAEALQVIANWPITDPKNMDAVNMASVAREALVTLPTAMSWIDSEGVHHSMSFDAARDLIKEFFEQWPGGLGEVEASVDGWRRKALTSAPPAPSVGGWISVGERLPECDGETVYIGENEAGYMGCFNCLDHNGIAIEFCPFCGTDISAPFRGDIHG